MAPLIACAILPVAATAGYAAAAIALAVASGRWDHTWGTAQQTVRIVDVALISVTAVLVAAVRIRREHQHARVVAIAEVAQRAILPTLPPTVGGVSVAARYVSAAQDTVVGGDLYDCYHSATFTRFLVGDVRGKDIAAVERQPGDSRLPAGRAHACRAAGRDLRLRTSRRLAGASTTSPCTGSSTNCQAYAAPNLRRQWVHSEAMYSFTHCTTASKSRTSRPSVASAYLVSQPSPDTTVGGGGDRPWSRTAALQSDADDFGSWS